MKPLNAATSDLPYFWIGEGTPTVTDGVPQGALYIDEAGGNHWKFLSGAWVDVTDLTLAAMKVALVLPKTYRALLTQAGTAAPTAVVLQNELSATIVWTRTGVGVYIGTLAAAFTASKTLVRAAMSNNAAGAAVTQGYSFVRTSADVVTLTTFDGVSAVADALLTSVPVEILVYP